MKDESQARRREPGRAQVRKLMDTNPATQHTRTNTFSTVADRTHWGLVCARSASTRLRTVSARRPDCTTTSGPAGATWSLC